MTGDKTGSRVLQSPCVSARLSDDAGLARQIRQSRALSTLLAAAMTRSAKALKRLLNNPRSRPRLARRISA